MVKSCLHVPDASLWQYDDAYNPSVARLLSYAHTHLTASDEERSDPSLPDMLIRPALGYRMSKRQRLIAYYLLAQAAMNRDELGGAIESLDEAYALATELLEVGALAELARLRGIACQHLQRFAEAADASWDCLVLMRDPRAGFGPDDLTTEAEIRIVVAQSEFLRGDYALADIVLSDAEALVDCRADLDTIRLHIAWTRALLHRWRGEYSTALPIAMEVAEAFSARGSPSLSGRIETVVADLSMDRAQTFANDPASSIRSTFLTISKKYLDSSEAMLLKSPEDVGGAAMAELARIRLSRLTGKNEDRLSAILALEQVWRKVPDGSLVIQALTARGEELMARGERESGLAAFRQAVDLAEHSQVAAMGVWARRALLYDQEMHD
jgi:tetratricopeptide (TPR) repeat protein